MPAVWERPDRRRSGDQSPQDVAAPPAPEVAQLLALQRSAGNQAVARMLSRRLLARDYSPEFLKSLDVLAWPNVPTAGAIKAIAERAAAAKEPGGVAGQLINEIGQAMILDQKLEVITKRLKAHAKDKDVTDAAGKTVIDTFKGYLSDRRPDLKDVNADMSARGEWEKGLTKPAKHEEEYRYLVSSIDTSKPYGMDRFQNPWLFNVQAVSMSLISPEHPHTYQDFGYIFDVPQECILVAAADDIGTSNTAYDAGPKQLKEEIEKKLVQADSGIRTSQAIAKHGDQPPSTANTTPKQRQKMAKEAGIDTKGLNDTEIEAQLDKRVMDWTRKAQKDLSSPQGAPSLRGPEDILAYTGKAGHLYNEIYVAGTSLDGAKQIRPSGVFYNPDVFTPKGKEKPSDKKKRAEWDKIQAMADQQGIPLVPIKQPEIAKTKPKKKEKKEKKKEKATS
jgi:hypothetical protein